MLGKEMLQLIENTEYHQGKQAVLLGDHMGKIAHMQICELALSTLLIAKEMELMHLFICHRLNTAAQLEGERWYAMNYAGI